MSISPPKIDKRTIDDVLTELKDLSRFYTPDWDAINQDDSGVALSKIFAYILDNVINRLNGVPQRNYLEFLNMLGIMLTPAHPASAPVTFNLSDGVKQDVLIPVGTKLGVAATEKHGELIFETEEDMLATRAKIQEICSVVNTHDSIYQHTEDFTKKNPFIIFNENSGNHSTDQQKHVLYIGDSNLLNIKNGMKFSLRIRCISSDNAKILYGFLSDNDTVWEYDWKIDSNGKETSQQFIATVDPPADTECIVHLQFNSPDTENREIQEIKIGDITSRWIRCTLVQFEKFTDNIHWEMMNNVAISDMKIEVANDLLPDMMFYNDIPIKGEEFFPFGEKPSIYDSFYISSKDAFSKKGSKITFNFKYASDATATLTFKNSYPVLSLEYWNGKSWANIPSINELPNNSHQFTCPADIDVGQVNGNENYWIRIRLASGDYGKEKYVKEVKEIACYVYDSPIAGTTPLYRLLNSANGDHFYTTSATERDNAIAGSGYHMENMPCYVYDSPIAGTTPLYRLFNSSNHHHFYTTSREERDNAIARLGYHMENMPCYVYDSPIAGTTPLYRLLNSANGDHFYTTSATERDNAIAGSGYQIEEGDNYVADTRDIKKLKIKVPKISIELSQKPTNCLSYNNLQFESFSNTPGIITPFKVIDDTHPTFYIGFDNKIEKGPISIFFSLTQELEFPDDSWPQIDYYYYSANGWQKLDTVDETGNLTRSGNVKFYFPLDFAEHKQFEKNLYWIKGVDIKDEFVPKQPIFKWDQVVDNHIYMNNLRTFVFPFLKTNLQHQLVPNFDKNKINNLRNLIFTVNDNPILIKLNDKNTTATLDINNKTAYVFDVKSKNNSLYVYESGPVLQLNGIYLNTIPTMNVQRIIDEIIGTSNGMQNQIFQLAKPPLLLGKFETQIWINESKSLTEDEKIVLNKNNEIQELKDSKGNVLETWVLWHEVKDIYTSSQNARDYMLDRALGTIRFGDGRHGKIIPVGRDNIKASYVYGGGSQGNVNVKEINSLKNSIPFVDSVVNPEPSAGGMDVETLEKVLQRGSQIIKHRRQPVTFEDFEWIVKENFPSLARVKCLSTTWIKDEFKPGNVMVVIVPNSSEEKPVPPPTLIKNVQKFLEERSSNVIVTKKHLKVIRPYYVKVSIIADIYPISIDIAPMAEKTALAGIKKFLHPLSGGTDKRGWEFGRIACVSDIFNVLEKIKEIDHVENLSIKFEFEDQNTQDDKFFVLTPDVSNIPMLIPSYSLMYSGEHNLTSKFEAV